MHHGNFNVHFKGNDFTKELNVVVLKFKYSRHHTFKFLIVCFGSVTEIAAVSNC